MICLGATIRGALFNMYLSGRYKRWELKGNREFKKGCREVEKQLKAKEKEQEKALKELVNRELSKRRQMLDQLFSQGEMVEVPKLESFRAEMEEIMRQMAKEYKYFLRECRKSCHNDKRCHSRIVE
ncbi:MAG: hypothetical protein NC321_02580 [Clostridium sp.]|nr:hypothetical protein [Clostridium sp.]